MRKTTSRALAALSLLLASPAAFALPLELAAVSQTSVAGGAEIAQYDPATGFVFSTHGSGVESWVFNINSFSAPTNISMANTFSDLGGNVGSVSSVALDPLGRGFGIATVIPTIILGNDPVPAVHSGNTLGRVVLFNSATGAILNTLTAGYHPDMAMFTADGNNILIANEGEYSFHNTEIFDRPGSISRIDTSAVSGANLAGTTAGLSLNTFDFTAANLNAGVAAQLNALRLAPEAPALPDATLNIEPEYITVRNGKAYVTLQEANGVGVFDLASNKWEAAHNLGTITQLIDASDRDGAGNTTLFQVNDSVKGMPMPDAIASYTVNGNTYYVTANEGDTREFDEARWNDIDDQTNNGGGDVVSPAGAGNNQVLGRLTISRLDGNLDADASIEDGHMFGTRSFSIWDSNGNRVSDSGSDFENITYATAPTFFNSENNLAANFDTRSDNKGPEPEGVAVKDFGDLVLAAIVLERTGGVMLYNVTDPTAPVFMQYLRTNGVGPESVSFFQHTDGLNYLLVSYEVSNTIEAFRVIPEPASIALLAIGATALLRRRKA